ncbi:hypothetical protein [Streptomyces sp. NRRL F-5650]|uniref:hypothetical protein n=1 Tax=Streptomyces sp. NRRL F-5650 TaxID=1463868 RepID=UPI0004C58195|nr:hypothetical protein [Streptomyces sp. NRRL F-5650]
MPHHAPDAPAPDQIREATSTLAGLAAYLRTHPPLDDVLPLLAPLLDEDDGVPMLLGDALRCTEHLIGQQAAYPVSDETRLLMKAFREAAQEFTDWHILHWDVQRLRTQTGAPGR